ncbi:MAG: carotenoid 1,2-hydratase [Nitrospirae bacterium]|nr:carotenoid 1,2-hydratase [Nitrospirota bacterium]
MRGLLVLCCLTAALFSFNVFAQEYAEVTHNYKPKFPDDFFYKRNFKIQWWYFTGHLFDDKGREFGYELTFFSVGIQKREYRSKFGLDNIYISHFAVSDVDGKRFLFSDRADRGAFDFAGAQGNYLKVWVGKAVLEGSVDRMHIKASDKDKAIDMLLLPAKPVILNGDNGYSRKSEESPEIASIYFSYPLLKTEGTLKIGGDVFHVSGTSWFDREISSRGLGKNETGWDWFAVQLDDGREIMLYMLRKKDGSIDRFSSGTFVYRDGAYRQLLKDDYTVAVLEHYKSKKTGARYPSQWRIDIPSENISLKVIPLIRDQEFLGARSTGNYYWEGTCKVEGTAQGKAYVELTGY